MFTALSAVDRRKNGVVSKNEFKTACETTNSKLTPVEVERMVKYID
jgi:Ca2+-binding EF-hand superfamily protein